MRRFPSARGSMAHWLRVRALIVSNMLPSRDRPARGSFVRDQVRALQRLGDLEVELFEFGPGRTGAYVNAARELRARYGRGPRFDVVHAHFGLTAWPAFAAPGQVHAVTLHGTDLVHPRSRAITLGALPFLDLVATVSESLAGTLPRWASRSRTTAVLPIGVDTDRFAPIPRREARATLGLDPAGPYVLFPADPERPEKRHDRAIGLALAEDVPLLTLGAVEPTEVPLWVNAANAVLVPSEREGFGLAVLEALACDVPVLATPVGIAPVALRGIAGAYCGPFHPGRWREALAPLVGAADPRVDGRPRAQEYSTDRMAARVAAAWRELV